MNNELQQHQQCDRIKWKLTLLGFVLLFLAVIGLSIGMIMQNNRKSETVQAEEESEFTVMEISSIPLNSGSSDYEFEMTLNKGVFTATYNIFTYKGYVWKLIYCEGNAENYWRVMSGTNYKEQRVELTTSTFSYPLSNIASTLREGVTYSFALYGASNDGSMYYGSNVIHHYYRTPVALPANPTKEGHTFTGWYYGNSSSCNNNCTPYDEEPIYADTALHAHFSINTFTVKYESNGGTEYGDATVNWNTAASMPTPERLGYTFLGWTVNGQPYNGEGVTSNITLSASWEPQRFTVTFYVDGETYNTIVLDYGASLIQVVSAANAMNLRVLAVKNAEGSIINPGEGLLVMSDCEVEAVTFTGVEKVVSEAKMNWLGIAGGIVLAVGVLAIVGVIVGKVKTKKRRTV